MLTDQLRASIWQNIQRIFSNKVTFFNQKLKVKISQSKNMKEGTRKKYRNLI